MHMAAVEILPGYPRSIPKKKACSRPLDSNRMPEKGWEHSIVLTYCTHLMVCSDKLQWSITEIKTIRPFLT